MGATPPRICAPMPVTALAKWKTTLQMLALGFLLVGPVGPDFGPLTTTEIGIIGLWGAALLTLVTGADYLIVGVRQIANVDSNTPPATDKPDAVIGADKNSGKIHTTS